MNHSGGVDPRLQVTAVRAARIATLALAVLAGCPASKDARHHTRLTPGDAYDPDRQLVMIEPAPSNTPVTLPSIDLAGVPVVLPPGRGQTRSLERCSQRYHSAPLVAGPRRLLDSVAGFGIDGDGRRVLRFSPIQIDMFDDGAWQRVADQQTIPPGAEAPFTQLLGAWIEAGAVVFRGDFDGQFGLFLWQRGSLAKLVDRTTTAPDGSLFTELGRPVISGGTVWFWAESGGKRSESTLYSWRDGHIHESKFAVRATSTPIPRGKALIFSGHPRSSPTLRGIYTLTGDRLELVVPPTARTSDGAPLGPLILGEPKPHDGGLLFITDADPDQSRRGLWFSKAGTIHAAIDPDHTLLDDRVGFFMVAAVGPFADADVVLFQAHRRSPTGERIYGLYAARDCTLFTLVESGMHLDDREVKSVPHMYPRAVVNGLVLFPVVFTDGTQATYAARLR